MTPTSTKTITKMGVLTVLLNGDPVDGVGISRPVRSKAARELRSILHGKTHVPQWKVRDRSLERCVLGGRCIGYEVGGATVLVTGVN